jgi:hypothetical protein
MRQAIWIQILMVLFFSLESAYARKDKVQLGRITFDDVFAGTGASSDGQPYQDQRLNLLANPCVTITVNNQGLFWVDLDESPSNSGPVSDPFPFYFKFTTERAPVP